MPSKLIVALDFNQERDVFELIDQLSPSECGLKVGSELFTLFGSNLVKQLVARGFNVFLDLKFHDIPNTVARACAAAADLGVWMINVHALGGAAMMQAAQKALQVYRSDKPLLIAVTLLTSLAQENLKELGIHSSLDQQVSRLALLAAQSGLDGVVCGAWEVPQIKTLCGKAFLTITPGIRLTEHSSDDQARIATVKQARIKGCDYIVVGRPITQAALPMIVVKGILDVLKEPSP
ncbi:MAG: orotidine 5'-phosphate decarboxylase [Legionellales bacterium RIFCSPHIGHO2_12_FULL_42_9]|nr:MAG: orotidine 5'-phosphate decarboxylase [Legionellales bacterium RIFCSPHIGHO2_12_FULL_42_9]